MRIHIYYLYIRTYVYTYSTVYTHTFYFFILSRSLGNSLLCVPRDKDRNGGGGGIVPGGSEAPWQVKTRATSIMYETQLNFVEFVALFRSFSLRARKDLRDLFGQLAITCRSQSDGSLRDFSARPAVLRQASDATPQRIGRKLK